MARRLEAVYLTADVVGQRRASSRRCALRPGERVLDIGCGPGLLACEMAGDVGPGGAGPRRRPQREHARDRAAAPAAGESPRAASAPARYRTSAPRPTCEDASFDVAVCTQVYEYVDDMRGRAGRGAARAAPGRPAARARHRLGLDRLALQRTGADAARARGLGGAPRRPVPAAPPGGPAARRGLHSCAPVAIPILNAGSDPDTYSAGLIGVVAAFVPGRQGLTARTRAPGERPRRPRRRLLLQPQPLPVPRHRVAPPSG